MNRRAALHYGLGCIAQRSLSLLLLPLTSTVLGISAFGQLGLLVALANVGSIVAGLGLAETAQRFAAMPQRLAQLATLTRYYGGLWLLLSPCTLLLAPWLPGQLQGLWLWLLWLNLGCGAQLGVRLMLLRIADRSGRYAKVMLLWSGLQGSLTMSALLLGFGVGGVMFAGAAATALALGYSWRGESLPPVDPAQQGVRSAPLGADPQPRHRRFAHIMPLLRYGVPMALCTAIGVVFVGYERPWLAQTLGVAALGQYALMAQLAFLPIYLIEPFNLWWFPRRMALAQQRHHHELARWSDIGVFLLLLAVLLVALLLPPVVQLLFAPDYWPALQWLPGLLAIALLRQLASVLNLGVYFRDSGQLPLRLNAAIALPALLLVPLAVAGGGVLWLLWLMLGLMAVRAGLFYWRSQQLYCLPYQRQQLLLALTVGLAALVVDQPLGYASAALLQLGLLWRRYQQRSAATMPLGQPS
ncbi:hypothetical protein [uncultured Ferrimonas sp.]|uniref:hypothetical protein n=1 Tax=uncultured Ferrimonas sp. TaxID=432640 RepID=UPI0026079CD3|nr:hypothetical protein [uncultured Ferrimonas sp.]